MYEYRAQALRAVDGDTIEVSLELGFRVGLGHTVRLLDVSTPDRGEPGWAEATDITAAWLKEHPVLLLRTHKPRSYDKYRRYLAEVWDINGVDHLNEHLRAHGYGWTRP